MQNLITTLKTEVKEASQRATFIHHTWFVKFHLDIVEKIAEKLCEKYPTADKNLVLILVWLHDYGKIVDIDNQYSATLTLGKEKLLEIGFPHELVNKAISYIKILDEKNNLTKAPIEVQIVSSADAASHLIGPFYKIYWKEYSHYTYAELLKENYRKILVDWNKKVVLPEVKKAFLSRHKHALEQCGKLPKNIFDNL